MATVRACRADYYRQHEVDHWQDQLGSLGLGGEDSAFINLAAVAGPVPGRPEAMMAVNYNAPLAAARACEALGFGHWIQGSTQAVKAERGGQVGLPTVRMLDRSLFTHLFSLPPTIPTPGSASQ